MGFGVEAQDARISPGPASPCCSALGSSLTCASEVQGVMGPGMGPSKKAQGSKGYGESPGKENILPIALHQAMCVSTNKVDQLSGVPSKHLSGEHTVTAG